MYFFIECFKNFIIVSSLLTLSFWLTGITVPIVKLFEFYEFICENNPLFLSYYDETIIDTTLDCNKVEEIEQSEEKKKKPFEIKYLEKYKNFPNKYIFYDFELEDEKNEYEKIKINYENKRKKLLNEFQNKLLEIKEIEDIIIIEEKKKAILKYLYDKDENYEKDEEYENIEIEDLYTDFLYVKYKLLKEQKEEEDNIMTEDDMRLQANNNIINKKLDKYIDNYVLEYTPLGNIYMRYNNDKKSFEYFSNSTIPYRYLEVVGRKYVMTYWCKPIFIDLEEELKKAEEKYDQNKKKKEEENNKKEDDKKNNPKRILAQLKNYNKEKKEQTMRPMKNRTNNNTILPPQIKANLPDVNKVTEKQLLKETANRYTWEGRLTNFCPLKKIDKKIINKNLELTYADFKKLHFKKT